MNNGSWDIGLWLRKIINDATEHIVSWVGTVEMRVDALITQESTNSQKINDELHESTEEILTAVESIQSLFKSAAEANLEPSEALEGKLYYNGTVLKTGTMKDKSGMTVMAASETYDGDNVYYGIPERACYNQSSKICVPEANRVYCLGNGTSFDISHIPGYENLTEDNFVFGIDSISVSAYANVNDGSRGSNGAKPTISYDASTGKVTVTGTTITASSSFNFNAAYPYGSNFKDHNANGGATITITYKVYLVIRPLSA